MLSNQIDLKSLRELIYKLNPYEQEEISRFLDELILEKRIKKFIDSKKDISLSLEEITQEVEREREKRYKYK